jgi:hypothetical protein
MYFFCIDCRRQHEHEIMTISGKDLIMMASFWHNILTFMSSFPSFWDFFPALCVLVKFIALHVVK